MKILLLLLLGAFCAAELKSEAEAEKKTPAKEGDDILELKIIGQRERFFGSFSTTTYTIVSAVTSTVFMSCLSGTDPTVCQGRSGRRFRQSRLTNIELESDHEDAVVPDLDSSTWPTPEGRSYETNVELEESAVSQPRFGFTVWTTAKQTTSVTVFFTNTSTTVRISYYCVAGGASYPANNCAG